VGKGQGTEGRFDFCQETAQDVSRCDLSDSSGSKGSLGKVAKATEDGLTSSGFAHLSALVSDFRTKC
jgi:hypothetical protein